MARFQFKFAAVRRQRQIAEDQKQRALAQLLRTRLILQNQLRSMQDTISQSKRDLGDSLVGKVDLDRIGQFARYSGQVTIRAREMVSRMGGLEQQIDAARRELLAAARARKALDLLYERHRAEWQRTQDLRETAQLDDLALSAYTRGLLETHA